MRRRYSAGQSRRSVLTLLALSGGLLAARRSLVHAARAQSADTPDADVSALQPGQFFWHPERAPAGPVVVIVSIPKQLVFVYRNGLLIGVSTCSTGKPGHDTPAGVFTIMEKAKTHESSTYHEPMPDMQRLTWKGIALHVGDLPGYPDSHGCVHLPPEFADDVYGVTQIGTPVIIAGGHSDPASVADPGAILGSTVEEELKAKVGTIPAPASPNAVTSILVSSADKRIYVLENGNIVAEGEAITKDPSEPLGSTVFLWKGGEANGPNGSSWEGLGFQAAPGEAPAPSTSLLQRIDGAPWGDGRDQEADQARHGARHHGPSGWSRHPLRQGLYGDGRAHYLTR